MEKLKFKKYHGLGNDFVMIKDVGFSDERYSEIAKKVCHRKLGIGADGLIVVKGEDNLYMMIINSDGSIDTMCGNGIRCFACFVLDEGMIDKNEFKVETGGGTQFIKVYEHSFGKILCEVDLGVPKFFEGDFSYEIGKDRVDGTFLNNGTPHAVYFLDKNWHYFGDEGLKNLKKITEIGEEIVTDIEKFGEEVSVNFPIIRDRKNIDIVTVERGCGLTSACGTGTTASVASGIRLGLLDDEVTCKLMYGQLVITKTYDGHFLMRGPAEKSFEGEIIL